jgi:hypothetical protein
MKLKGPGLLSAHQRAEFPVGHEMVLPNGNVYEYSRYSTSQSVFPAQGSPVGWRNVAAQSDEVTTDLSLSKSGLLCGACAASDVSSSKTYFWRIKAGDPRLDGFTLKTDGTVADTQLLVWKADKVFGGATSGTHLGPAIGADSDSQLVAAKLQGVNVA